MFFFSPAGFPLLNRRGGLAEKEECVNHFHPSLKMMEYRSADLNFKRLAWNPALANNREQGANFYF
jgi:hypothetical protein